MPSLISFMHPTSQRNGVATTLATDLHGSLLQAGMSVWFDVKMDDRSKAAMRGGVENSDCVLAIITGPCTNEDDPTQAAEVNAYFKRDFCLAELRWARDAGIKIQPIIRAADKGRIGELMSLAPEDLQFLADVDFITLDRSDKDYWQVGVDKILKAAGKAAPPPNHEPIRNPSGGSGGVMPPAYTQNGAYTVRFLQLSMGHTRG